MHKKGLEKEAQQKLRKRRRIKGLEKEDSQIPVKNSTLQASLLCEFEHLCQKEHCHEILLCK